MADKVAATASMGMNGVFIYWIRWMILPNSPAMSSWVAGEDWIMLIENRFVAYQKSDFLKLSQAFPAGGQSQ